MPIIIPNDVHVHTHSDPVWAGQYFPKLNETMDQIKKTLENFEGLRTTQRLFTSQAEVQPLLLLFPEN